MTKQELQEWLYEKLFNCYWVKHKTNPDVKFLIYDKQFIRDCKLSSVLGGNITFPVEHTGDILFEQDLKNKYIFCDYDIIWTFFELNYNDNYHKIKDLITGFLGEIDNSNQYTSFRKLNSALNYLGEIDNSNQYTSVNFKHKLTLALGEIDNSNQYTSLYATLVNTTDLDEIDNYKEYISLVNEHAFTLDEIDNSKQYIASSSILEVEKTYLGDIVNNEYTLFDFDGLKCRKLNFYNK